MASKGTEDKSLGSFYTPEWCVRLLLRMSGFSALDPRTMLHAKVMDPACGDGAILIQVLKEKIANGRALELSDSDIAEQLTQTIFGIELEPAEADKCREALSSSASSSGLAIPTSEWNIRTGNTFDEYIPFIGEMDFVIGNPPYVRIHNLDEKPDSPYISGMCDLYLAFYDVGQQLLSPDGKLCYISPSSWMTSVAGRPMRDHLRSQGNLSAMLDFEHFQVFDNATTYTAIVVLEHPSKQQGDIALWRFDAESLDAEERIEIGADAAWCVGNLYTHDVTEIRDLLELEPTKANADREDSIRVRNGYATMCDKAYISDNGFDGCEPLEIEIVKASRGKIQKAIYPHGKDGQPLPLDEIKQLSNAAYERLCEWKPKLLARNRIDENHWWAYGRTQGIADTYLDKLSIQSLYKPGVDLVIKSAPAGVGIYGGLYVIGIEEDALREAVSSPTFDKYVHALGKYKSGGYYAFSGKELERFLIWWSSRR